jgi:hypothetical protein
LKNYLFLTLALSLPSPTLAQVAAPAAPLHRPLGIEAEIAPQLASDSPFQYGNSTDTTVASLSVTAKPKLSGPFTLKLSAGPSATLDADGDNPDGASSAMNAAAEIGLPAGQGLTFFGSAAHKQKFGDFFSEDKGSQQTYTTGLKFNKDVKDMPDLEPPSDAANTLSAVAAFGLTDASDNARDQSFAQLKAGFSTPVGWWGAFDVEAAGTRRWFQNADAVAGFKERSTEFGASVGFNIARAIVSAWGDPDNAWLRKAKVGFAYARANSNIKANDGKSFSPSVAFAIGRDF